MKNFLKVLDKNDAAFQNLCILFLALSSSKQTESVYNGFLGNTCVPDWQECIEKLLQSYEDMGCRVPLKIHFFHSLNFFSPQSDELGERFHQYITNMESNYEDK